MYHRQPQQLNSQLIQYSNYQLFERFLYPLRIKIRRVSVCHSNILNNKQSIELDVEYSFFCIQIDYTMKYTDYSTC